MDLVAHKDIDYKSYSNFSDKFTVKVDDIEAMDDFISDALKAFIESSKISHIESNGEAILIFTSNFRLAQLQEYSSMIKIMMDLRDLIKK
ncbi:MAG: hypothetical protein ACI8XB_001762 [Patiriisocius sp.]|jgi:hypothetical protein